MLFSVVFVVDIPFLGDLTALAELRGGYDEECGAYARSVPAHVIKEVLLHRPDIVTNLQSGRYGVECM